MATRTLLGAAGLLTCLLLVIPTAARSAAGPLPGDEIPEDPAQPPEGPPAQPPEGPPQQPPEGPPEQPPEGPPEQPPGEEEATGEVTQPPAEEPPLMDETAATGPAGEEATGEASEGADEETEGESEESEGRAPEIATAPVGILPGGLLAAPAPVPGTAIVGMVFADDGFLLHMAGGEVIAYERDGEATRWGLPGADAAFVAQDSGSVVLLDERGDVTLRRFADGVRVGGFSTGLKPDAGMVTGAGPRVRTGAGPRAGRGPAAATLSGGVLYWVSAGTLHGYRVPAGNAVVEVALPDGEAASVVAAASTTVESAGDVPPLLLVSLGSGGVAAVSPSGGTTSGALRWHAEGAGPVTGPVLALAEERLAIFGDEGGDLTAVDLETGKPRWRWRLAEGLHHPPLLSRGRLYAATKANSLYCFDAKRGGERWRAALPGRPAAPPLRIAGAVLVVTQDGLLVELNAETGARIGSPHDLGAEVLGVVRRLGDGAREDGWRDRRLFMGLRDGRLAVFGPRASRGGP